MTTTIFSVRVSNQYSHVTTCCQMLWLQTEEGGGGGGSILSMICQNNFHLVNHWKKKVLAPKGFACQDQSIL